LIPVVSGRYQGAAVQHLYNILLLLWPLFFLLQASLATNGRSPQHRSFGMAVIRRGRIDVQMQQPVSEIGFIPLIPPPLPSHCRGADNYQSARFARAWAHTSSESGRWRRVIGHTGATVLVDGFAAVAKPCRWIAGFDLAFTGFVEGFVVEILVDEATKHAVRGFYHHDPASPADSRQSG